jgi:hypothetical protein
VGQKQQRPRMLLLFSKVENEAEVMMISSILEPSGP